MKRIILLLTIALFVCALFGCQKNDDSLYFGLDSLPDIGDYTPEKTNERWYENYTDTVIPRDDYGPLRPYCGNIVDFNSPFFGSTELYLYGLCTESGVIVTDPVYTSVEKCGDWYILRSRELKKNDEDSFSTLYQYSLAKTDGSAYIPLDSNASYASFFFDDMVYLNCYPKNKLYDLEGNLLAEYENAYIRQDDDYLILTEHGEITQSGALYQDVYLLDRDLNVIAGPEYDISCLGNKLYTTRDMDGRTRLFTIDGQELLEDMNIKSFTGYIDEMFLVSDERNAYVYDYDMNLLASLSFTRKTNVGLLKGNILSLDFGNRNYEYRDFQGNKLDYENISFLTEHYVMSRGNTTYIADREMNVIAEVEGKYTSVEEDPQAGLIYLHSYGSSSIKYKAYSLKTLDWVLDDVMPLYSHMGVTGFYYSYEQNSDNISTTYRIYRVSDGKMIHSGNDLPTYMKLDEEMLLFMRDGDFALTLDENFNEIMRVRINND